jgi:hypothetical protein
MADYLRQKAFQCHLKGRGYVLWPGTPENPPKEIKEEEFVSRNPMIFYKPNPNTPVLVFKFNYPLLMWCRVDD